MSKVFSDLKVVELASVLAGPAVGMFFAELGAQVIKIENKTTGGDVTRNWKLASEPKEAADSAYYKSINWGKESVFLDLSQKDDRAKLQPYLQEADIVLCNFRAGSAEKLGLDYPSLSKLNPKIIYTNLTAFGAQDRQPGFDVLLQAETGFLSMTGHPGEAPAKMPVALIDVLAAHQLKEAILIALLQRERHGRGSYIHASLAQTAIASLVNQASNFLNEGFVAQKMGTQHPNISPYGDIFYTADNIAIILAIGTDKHFVDLCNCLDMAHLSKDPRFESNAARVAHREDLISELTPVFLAQNGQDLLAAFKRQSVPAGQIRNMREVFDQDFAKAMILKYVNGSSCVRTISFEISPFEP